ncbi:MAG TPA: GMC family oxidoreductase [Steroidobacteraceae bacterium]
MYLADNNLADGVGTDWEVIVVGAGAVGLVTAASLARAGLRVLLLETGSADPGAAQDLNEVVMTGRPHLGALHGRARVVGGTTTLWGGQLTQFVPYDFESRSIMPDAAWPISFADVASHYGDVASLLGLDLAHLSDSSLLPPQVGAEESGCEFFLTRWLRESNLARWFADDLENRPNLCAAPLCHASELLCGNDASAITGVRVRDRRGLPLDFRGRQVVLACGTIEISRLLLLTGRKNPGWTWCSNPHIGAYFQDHLDLIIGKIQVNDKRRFADRFENLIVRGLKYQPKIRMLGSTLKKEGLLNIACSMRFDSRVTEDLQALKQFVKALRNGTTVTRPIETLKRIAALNRVWFPLIWRYLRHRRVLAIADRGISVIAHCEQRPMKESRISLDAARVDRFGDPVAELHWVLDEELQMKSLQSFAAHLQRFLGITADAELVVEPALTAGDAGLLTGAADSYHQCGGARMGKSAGDGVVDSDCKVFGTENLYVAGAAVFPCASFANPTYTAMALARRLCDRLTGERPLARG